MISSSWQDLRYGMRVLLKQPVFTLVVIITLAAGIWLNSAIFSVINSVLIRPLPYKDPGRLVQIWASNEQNSSETTVVSRADFLDWRKQAQSFENLSAYNVSYAALTTTEGTVQIYGAMVTSNFFEVLGVTPILGRTFIPKEDAGQKPVVIISYGLWLQRLGGRPDVIGQTLVLSDVPYTIIGVLGPGYHHPEPKGDQITQYWRLLMLQEGISRKSRYLRAMGRLRHGVTIKQAQAEMSTIAMSWVIRRGMVLISIGLGWD